METCGSVSAMSSQAEPTADPRKKEHGLSQKAEEIVRFANFSITNSIVVTWIVALGLIAFGSPRNPEHEVRSRRTPELL